MLPPFADLRWVTSLSDCAVNLDHLAQGKVFGCDPYGRGGALGYPPLSVQVARVLHVQGAHTGIIGFAMGIAIIAILISLLYSLYSSGWQRNLFGGLLLLSFPVQQALERSNIDVVIFILLTSLAASLSSSKRWTFPAVAFISWLTVAIKLYPVAGIYSWLVLGLFKRRHLNYLAVATTIGASLGLATALPWFLNYGKSAAQPAVGPISHAFVFSLPLSQIENRLPLLAKIIELTPPVFIGSFIILLTLFLCIRIQFFSYVESTYHFRKDGFTGRFLLTMPALLGCVWLGCYFLSKSFDYRLILALPAFICLLSLLDISRQDRPKSFFAFATLVAVVGFANLLLPLLQFSPLFPQMVSRSLLLLSDVFLMPFMAAAILSIIVSFTFGRSSS